MSELKYTSKGALLADANLKAYYRMESGALTTDSSGNGKTLTNTGTVGEGTGVFGGCADFGTANTTKKLEILDKLSYAGGAFSISFWVKMRTEIASATQRLVCVTDTVTSLTKLQVFYAYNAGTRRLVFNRLRMNVANDEGYIVSALGTTNWHHIVITLDGSGKRTGYLDGTLGTQFTQAGNGTSAAGYVDNFAISQDLDMNAYIDDVAVFNRELTQAEVTALYNDVAADTNLLTNYRLRKRVAGAVSV